ncbi:MAG: hypothetical protein E7161_03855 [Firmicutes bacterium]|nr:hypothetical protein [Bacillota bacterium]
MNLLKDIYTFISYLSFVDIVFFIAIITLLILIVTLIYFIRINKEVLGEDDFFPPSENSLKDESKVDEHQNIIEQIEIKTDEKYADEYNDEEGELLDLESLTKKLKAEENSDRISCTEYEKDQEEKAIISYEELLEKRNKYAINYEKEEVIDDLIVKKVNLNDLVNKNEEEIIKEEVRVISYQKEEAFLSALKELNSLLN